MCYLIRYFKTFAAPSTFSLLYFAAGKERIAVSSHEQTVIITIVRPIGRKIKIPAPPERVLARLSSGKKRKTVSFIKEAAESKSFFVKTRIKRVSADWLHSYAKRRLFNANRHRTLHEVVAR